MSTTIQVRIDDELKIQATEVFDRLGIDFSTAIRMFLKKSVAVNGIPFEVRNETPSEAAAAVENMRKTAEENSLILYQRCRELITQDKERCPDSSVGRAMD